MDRESRSMIVINFCWACATAGPMAVLSLILRQKGVGVHAIGLIMGASVLASIIGAHIAGSTSVRYGPLRVAIAAIFCTILALLSFEWTTAQPVPALLSRLLQGLGFGIFMTAGISYVQNKASEKNQAYAIGMFSAMAITPYFFAQWEAQYWLDHYGSNGIFVLHSLLFLPVLAMALVLLKRDADQPAKSKSKNGSYWSILSVPQVYPPYACHLVNGMLFGFGASFLPIMLKDSSILLGFYFMPYAVVALGSRFFLLPLFQKLSKTAMLALGMISTGLGAIIPMVVLNVDSIALSGALYGFGYCFIGPAVLTSVGQHFVPAERPRANALAQNFFQVGSLISPIVASYAMGLMGIFGLVLYLGWIGIVALLIAIIVFVLAPRQRVVTA